MSDAKDALRLADIADQLDFIAASIADKDFDTFANDRLFHQAIAFSLQVVGEAANNLAPETRAEAPDVPWPKIIALRNRIAHGYFSLELTEIWRIATVDAPRLREQLVSSGLLASS